MATTIPEKDAFLRELLTKQPDLVQTKARNAVIKKFGSGVAFDVISTIKAELRAAKEEEKGEPKKAKKAQKNHRVWKDTKTVAKKKTSAVIDLSKVTSSDLDMMPITGPLLTKSDEIRENARASAKNVIALMKSEEDLREVRIYRDPEGKFHLSTVLSCIEHRDEEIEGVDEQRHLEVAQS